MPLASSTTCTAALRLLVSTKVADAGDAVDAWPKLSWRGAAASLRSCSGASSAEHSRRSCVQLNCREQRGHACKAAAEPRGSNSAPHAIATWHNALAATLPAAQPDAHLRRLRPRLVRRHRCQHGRRRQALHGRARLGPACLLQCPQRVHVCRQPQALGAQASAKARAAYSRGGMSSR